jgi:hypothetical protein
MIKEIELSIRTITSKRFSIPDYMSGDPQNDILDDLLLLLLWLSCNMRTAKHKRNLLVRFEATNVRIVYLKNYLREMKDVYVNRWVRQ